MRRFLSCAIVFMAAASGQNAIFKDGEVLRYNVNWPSGLSLGETQFTARRVSGLSWNFEMTLDAALPGFPIEDRYRAQASSSLCSERLEKNSRHGKRASQEDITFDSSTGKVTRRTVPKGGSSDFDVAPCARDALTFLYFVRQELAAGRIPGPQTVVFGAPYQIRFDFGGVKPVDVGGARQDADRLVAHLKGPNSELTFDLYFARDAARTLLLARVPLPVGAFTMELSR